jgi:hypothetical protein
MTKEEIINQMLEKYPSGFVGGRIRGIVGPLGMVIQWINPGNTIARASLKENDEVSVIFVRGDNLEVGANGVFYKAVVSPLFFKQFIVT